MIKTKLPNEKLEDIMTEGLTLVDVYANWCMPCKMIAKNIEMISDEIEIIKIDIDQEPILARLYSIDSIPTLLLFKNKKLLNKKIGYMEIDDLKYWIEQNK